MIHIFFDTEFTQFRNGELLSIGLVTERGEECYLEIDDRARHGRASDFCQDIVLPQFGAISGAAVRTDAEAAARLTRWLGTLPGVLALCSDYKLDRMHLDRLVQLSGQGAELAARLHHLDVADCASDPVSLAAYESYFDKTNRAHPYLMRHHALVDALALRERWNATR